MDCTTIPVYLQSCFQMPARKLFIDGYARDLPSCLRRSLFDYALAGGKGFEPLQAHPECAVLPLDEPPVTVRAILYGNLNVPSRVNRQILFRCRGQICQQFNRRFHPENHVRAPNDLHGLKQWRTDTLAGNRHAHNPKDLPGRIAGLLDQLA